MEIGFIGLGRMGGAMARNLQDSGHTLYVNDVRRAACDDVVAAGGSFRATPAEIARQAEMVLISVPGPDQVDAVLDGDDGLLAGRSWPCPWMLSGGLNPGNVAEAIRVSGAPAVDVSSGVESAPGVKDPVRIKAFLGAVSA